uniref:Fibronectin type-III domain-containing protein n=1 Tax=Junco hyemalis TaxID=40217 RepID=A0A8C5J030_JUNHY
MRGRAPLRSLPLLLLLLVLGSAAETPPYLPAPQNVEVYSYNFQSLLRWSPVPVENGTVLYTAEYQTGSCGNWSDLGCAQSPQPQCRFPPELQRRRWTILLRVRAELGTLASPWAHCPAFVAERDTTLGPPRVNNVSASPGSLLLSVSPPFAPEAGDILQYLVSYWENSTSATAKQKLSESNTLFQIGNLKESTLYCFRVQVQLRIYSGELLEGLPSAPECHRTALSEATRAGYIIPLFVLALVVANLVAAALLFLWKHHQKIKYWAQPPLEIPSHFKEVRGAWGFLLQHRNWGSRPRAEQEQRAASDGSKCALCHLPLLSCLLS